MDCLKVGTIAIELSGNEFRDIGMKACTSDQVQFYEHFRQQIIWTCVTYISGILHVVLDEPIKFSLQKLKILSVASRQSAITSPS